MLSPNPYMALSTALGFSAADLNANRLGALTPYQRIHLTNQRSRLLAWPAFLTALLLIAGVELQFEFILIAFVGACLVTYTVAIWQRFQEDFENHVKSVIGQVQPLQLQFGRRAVIVNGQRFMLSKHLTNAFGAHVRYRLYYTPGTHTILSAEII